MQKLAFFIGVIRLWDQQVGSCIKGCKMKIKQGEERKKENRKEKISITYNM